KSSLYFFYKYFNIFYELYIYYTYIIKTKEFLALKCPSLLGDNLIPKI
ncbi:LOW QUALITY PROTEIN: hypothetical protein TorRG33x02_008040, partial [Trema orientale]